MKPLLLDTHALVWAVSAPHRLSDTARTLLEDASTALQVSAASAWELTTKVRLGRFPEAEPLVERFTWAIGRLGARPRAISVDDALESGRLRWEHRDPFDRMLAAQAILGGATLLSRDRAFADVPGLDVRW